MSFEAAYNRVILDIANQGGINERAVSIVMTNMDGTREHLPRLLNPYPSVLWAGDPYTKQILLNLLHGKEQHGPRGPPGPKPPLGPSHHHHHPSTVVPEKKVDETDPFPVLVVHKAETTRDREAVDELCQFLYSKGFIVHVDLWNSVPISMQGIPIWTHNAYEASRKVLFLCHP